MLEVGSRRRNQPAPPHVIFEALTEPDRDPTRPWLRWTLLVGEPAPEPDLLEHMRRRLNVLINANLRYTFGS